MDILPTVLQEVGINIPSELVGTPLQSLLDPDTPRRKYIHTFNTGSAATLLYLTFGIRNEHYKLIYNPVRAQNLAGISRYQNSKIPESLWQPDYVDPPEFELYNLDNDPNEFTNLASRPTHRETRDRLFQAMRDFQKEISDPFLDPANIEFYLKEMKDPARQPTKKTPETWSHLQEFYGKR
jgi:N-sulfoglucosamine sulfohydrolase